MRFFTINRIWVLLLLATAVTWWLGESGQVGQGTLEPVLTIFGMAIFKGLWVVLDFMDLRRAPALWRHLLLGWLGAVSSLIVLAYWLGMA